MSETEEILLARIYEHIPDRYCIWREGRYWVLGRVADGGVCLLERIKRGSLAVIFLYVEENFFL